MRYNYMVTTDNLSRAESLYFSSIPLTEEEWIVVSYYYGSYHSSYTLRYYVRYPSTSSMFCEDITRMLRRTRIVHAYNYRVFTFSEPNTTEFLP